MVVCRRIIVSIVAMLCGQRFSMLHLAAERPVFPRRAVCVGIELLRWAAWYGSEFLQMPGMPVATASPLLSESDGMNSAIADDIATPIEHLGAWGVQHSASSGSRLLWARTAYFAHMPGARKDKDLLYFHSYQGTPNDREGHLGWSLRLCSFARLACGRMFLEQRMSLGAARVPSSSACPLEQSGGSGAGSPLAGPPARAACARLAWGENRTANHHVLYRLCFLPQRVLIKPLQPQTPPRFASRARHVGDRSPARSRSRKCQQAQPGAAFAPGWTGAPHGAGPTQPSRTSSTFSTSSPRR